MAGAPNNPAQSKALPISLPSAHGYGNIPGGDRTHPKEVWYRTGAAGGPATLRFQVFGAQTGEVALYVNWHLVRDITPTGGARWSGTRSTRIPASMLRASGQNVVGFVASGSDPNWSVWGVRQVSLG